MGVGELGDGRGALPAPRKRDRGIWRPQKVVSFFFFLDCQFPRWALEFSRGAIEMELELHMRCPGNGPMVVVVW